MIGPSFVAESMEAQKLLTEAQQVLAAPSTDLASTSTRLFSWFRSWREGRRNNVLKARLSEVIPRLQQAISATEEQLDSASSAKKQASNRALELLPVLDCAIAKRQKKVDQYDDLINDCLSLSYEMTKVMREIKAVLDFNDEVLSFSTRRRSSSRQVSFVETPRSLSQLKQAACIESHHAPAERTAEPAVWHGYKKAEAFQLGGGGFESNSVLSPKCNPIIHFSKSLSTVSLVLKSSRNSPTRSEGGDATVSSDTIAGLFDPSVTSHGVEGLCDEAGSSSPATTQCATSSRSSSNSSTNGSSDSASDGDADGEEDEIPGTHLINISARPSTPTIPLSKAVLDFTASTSRSLSSPAHTLTTETGSRIARRSSFSAPPPPMELSAYQASSGCSDSDFQLLNNRYMKCWTIYLSAQDMMNSLKSKRDVNRATLSTFRRKRDHLGLLCNADVSGMSSIEMRAFELLETGPAFRFDDGGRIHDSFTKLHTSPIAGGGGNGATSIPSPHRPLVKSLSLRDMIPSALAFHRNAKAESAPCASPSPPPPPPSPSPTSSLGGCGVSRHVSWSVSRTDKSANTLSETSAGVIRTTSNATAVVSNDIFAETKTEAVNLSPPRGSPSNVQLCINSLSQCVSHQEVLLSQVKRLQSLLVESEKRRSSLK